MANNLRNHSLVKEIDVDTVPRTTPVVSDETEAMLRVFRRIGLALLFGAVVVDVLSPHVAHVRKRVRTRWSRFADGVLPDERRLLDFALVMLDVSSPRS